MIPAQHEKHVVVTAPGALVDAASLTCNVIDTKGYGYLTIDLQLGATDIGVTALKLTESDVAASATALTNGADITGTVWGTASNIAGSTSTLPSATNDNTAFRWEIDLKGRKRYILPVVTIGDGSAGGYYTVTAKLSRPQDCPVTAAERGFTEIVRL